MKLLAQAMKTFATLAVTVGLAGLAVEACQWALADAYLWTGRSHAEYAFQSKEPRMEFVEKARSHWLAGLAVRSNAPELLEELGQLEMDVLDIDDLGNDEKQEHLNSAEAYYNELVQLTPSAQAAWGTLAWLVFKKEGISDRACRFYKQAVDCGANTVAANWLKEDLGACNLERTVAN